MAENPITNQNDTKLNSTWDAPTKRIVSILLGVLLVYVLYLSKAVLPFLIIAALIAFLLVPIVSFLHTRLHLPKWLAVILSYVLMILFILLFPLILIPAMADAFGDINVDLVALSRDFLVWLTATLESYRTIQILGIPYDFSSVVDPALDTLKNISPARFIPSLDTLIASIPSTLQLTWGVASNVLGTIISAILAMMLTFVFSIYLTTDGGNFVQNFIALTPENHRDEAIELHRRIKAIWSGYFRGQFILAVIIGLLTWIVGLSIGLPGALALAVIAGAMEILPNLGPILAAVPALLVALVQGSTTLDTSNLTFTLIVLIAYFLIQQVENNLVVPKILGDAVELHPIFVMAGVIVGATVGGLLGALIAAPSIASIRILLSYTYSKILDEDPFPPPEHPPKDVPSFTERLQSVWQKTQKLWKRFSA